jgi:hypothetical protein
MSEGKKSCSDGNPRDTPGGRDERIHLAKVRVGTRRWLDGSEILLTILTVMV